MGMTIIKRNNKLKHFITCLKCEVSGKNCDDNCPTQYAAGNMGEIIENLEAISKVLEQEPRKEHWIYDKSIDNWICSKCGETPKTIGYVGSDAFMAEHFKYCKHCGAEMESEKNGLEMQD